MTKTLDPNPLLAYQQTAAEVVAGFDRPVSPLKKLSFTPPGGPQAQTLGTNCRDCRGIGLQAA